MEKHKILRLENGNIHYWINKNADNKVCLFFSHGVTADHRCFEKQIEYFQNQYTTIRWDIPMHGLSKEYEFKSYKDCANLMNEIIVNENIDKVVLKGFSLGGYPSQMFIKLFPEKVLGFIAMDTTPFGLKYYSKADVFWLEQVEWMAKCFPTNLLKRSMAKSVSYTKESYQFMMKMYQGSSKNEIAKQMGIAYGRFIEENKDINIQCPVLILLGEYDKVGKVKKYCYDWSKTTNFLMKIIEKASHFANFDNSEMVNEKIHSFVKELVK